MESKPIKSRGGGVNMHVTKQTAHKLAAAGYPQPKSGGAWYADDLGETISTAMRGDAITWPALPGAAYAPNALELLQAMSGQCVLSHTKDGWEAHYMGMIEYHGRTFYHDNPAEALAEAYLHIHQPPQ